MTSLTLPRTAAAPLWLRDDAMNHNVAAPEHGSGHETSCFWGWHWPKCVTPRRHLPPAARPHLAIWQRDLETLVAKANLLQLTDHAVRFRVTRTRRTAAWLALPVLATAARTKSLLKLDDGLAAAPLLTHHARCCSDKKSFNGIHDIASTLRVWQWFSRCECCTCSVCLSCKLVESAKPKSHEYSDKVTGSLVSDIWHVCSLST